MRKPTKWPDLGYGGGSWEWDEFHKSVVLRFMIDGKRVKVRSGVSTADAIAKRDARRGDAVADAERHTRLINGDLTVAELMGAWLTHRFGTSEAEVYRGTKAPGTQDKYRRSAKLVAAQPLGAMRASDVNLGKVDAMLVGMANTYGTSVLKSVRSHLAMAFDYGIRNGYAAVNPARGAEMPEWARGPKEVKWLDAQQFPVMRRYLVEHESPANTALLVGLLTGLRPGEVLALQWDAVDFKEGTLEVKRNMQRSKNGRARTVVDGAKTVKSLRIVEMTPDLTTALRRLRQNRPFGSMFVNGQGNPLNFFNLRRACWVACRAIGVAPITPHQLRHSNGSMLLDLGVKPTHVADHLGHGLDVLSNTYRHKMRSRDSTAAALDDSMAR